MIIVTAVTESRAAVAPCAPPRVIAAMSSTSMQTTESVSTRVPKGSPRRTASDSAWPTTPKAQ